MASRRLPAASGVNRLNNGMIHAGATNWIVTSATALMPQPHAHADAPAISNSQRMAASSGPPSAIASSRPFRRSVTKVAGLVRLNPKRCSITNVDQTAKGSPIRVRAIPSPARKASPVATAPNPSARVLRSSHPKPPANQKTRSAMSCTLEATIAKRVRARV